MRSRRDETLVMMLRAVDVSPRTWPDPPDSIELAFKLSGLARLGQLLQCYAAHPGVGDQDLPVWEEFCESALAQLEERWRHARRGPEGLAPFEEALLTAIAQYRGVVGVMLDNLAGDHPPEVEGAPYSRELWLEDDLDTLDCIVAGRDTVEAILELIPPTRTAQPGEEIKRVDEALRSNIPRLRGYMAFHEGDVLAHWEARQRSRCFPRAWWWHYLAHPIPGGTAGRTNGTPERRSDPECCAVRVQTGRPKRRREELLLLMVRTVQEYQEARAAGLRVITERNPALESSSLTERLYRLARLGHMLFCYGRLPEVADQDLPAWEEFHASLRYWLDEEWGYLGPRDSRDSPFGKALSASVSEYGSLVIERIPAVLAKTPPSEAQRPALPEEVQGRKELDLLQSIAHARDRAQALLDLLHPGEALETQAAVDKTDAVLRSNIHSLLGRLDSQDHKVLGASEQEQERLCFPRAWWWHYPSAASRCWNSGEEFRDNSGNS